VFPPQHKKAQMRAFSTAIRYGFVAAIVAFVTTGAARAQDQSRLAVFVTLPVVEGFTDATHALVETQGLVREALLASDVRVVSAAQEADVVITVLGRGRGDVELTSALKALDDNVYATSVPIATTERYIEATVSVGLCPGVVSAYPTGPLTCYKRAFVGLGLSGRDLRPPTKKPPSNSWEACADALARDVRAWLNENAVRIRAFK
jgi:hypothetical protein